MWDMCVLGDRPETTVDSALRPAMLRSQ